jgi:hypothetical protein
MTGTMILTPYMRNPIIYFTYMPEDVMKLVNTFLDGESRANLNPILKAERRHYKKFPTDFAIHHAIITFMPAQRRHALAVADARDALDELLEFHSFDDLKIDEAKKKAIKVMKSYVAFLYSAQGTTIIQYRDGAKKGSLHDMRHLLSDECTLNVFIKPKLRAKMEKIIEDIEATPFIRDVRTPPGFRKSNESYPQ